MLPKAEGVLIPEMGRRHALIKLQLRHLEAIARARIVHQLIYRTLVIVGSVRQDRIGIRPAHYLQQCCVSRGHETTLIDPLEFRLPLLDRMYKEYPAGQAPEVLERLAKLIKAADAVLVVAGEYNHSIQPALSNLLDHFLEEWYWRPAAIACYSAGQYGGVRAAMQLRALLPEIGMPSIPSILALPKVQDLFDEQGQPRADWLARQAGRFLDELEWYARALKAARTGGVPY